MQTTLTHEEVDILNAILPYIEYNSSFKIEDIHAINFLKPLYQKDGGGVDLSKYDPARNDLRKRSVYLNIRNYLKENSFAYDPESENILSTSLKLTQHGEMLVAYGNICTYLMANEATTIDEIESRIPDIIARAYPYGEFTIRAELPRVRFMNLNIFTADEAGELAKIKKALDPKEQMIELHRQSVLDEEVLQYLVNNGFATNRHDIQVKGELYRQLTDKGRELKEYGSIEAFNNAINEKVEKAKQKEFREEELIKQQLRFNELNHTYTAKQYQLSDNQIETNKSVVKTNATMKTILWITAIATGLAAPPAYINLYRDKKIETLESTLAKENKQLHQLKAEKKLLENQVISLGVLLDSCKSKP